jgi:hypothetical protein
LIITAIVDDMVFGSFFGFLRKFVKEVVRFGGAMENKR